MGCNWGSFSTSLCTCFKEVTSKDLLQNDVVMSDYNKS